MLEGVAIIGMSGRFPGAASVQELWANLLAGVESISRFTAEEIEARDPSTSHPAYVRARGIVRDVDLFDANFFGISPREAELMDPQHRVFMECAWEALEDAGHDPARFGGPIGVYAGQSLNTYLLANLAASRAFLDKITGEYQVGSYATVLGNDKDYLATRVCYRFDLGGPGITVQCACSTSLVAVCQAIQALQTYQCDMALAGGVSITFPQRRGYVFQEGGMGSGDGHCRTFDEGAQGTVFSSGAGVVLLKRLEDALADGNSIYAVIRGAALNNDGARKVGYTAPSVERQAEVVATAQALAGFAPATVGFVESHGTGTPLGDPIEVAALTRAFSRGGPVAAGSCALGSLKTNLGHLEVASGVTGLIKAALVVQTGRIPGTLHFRKPNPKLELETSPFFVNAETIDWMGPLPRRAGVSAFGVGGTNAHVVIEEPPAAEAAPQVATPQLLLVSGRSVGALEKASNQLASWLLANPSENLADVAWTLQIGRRHFPLRRWVVATSSTGAAAALREPATPRAPLLVDSAGPEVAFLFPGQGSQALGMGSALYAAEPTFRSEVDRCCTLLEPHLGFDLRSLVFRSTSQDPAQALRLDQTEIAQPAIFVLEYALAKLWISWGVQPHAMLGHSVGEYVAACLAGVFSLEDALSLIAVRGRLIQALPPGAMVAVRLPEKEVLSLLSPGLSIAAVNGPRLCVASGPTEEIARLEDELRRRNEPARRLRTSHAFHSAMMEPMLQEFIERVRAVTLRPPQIPFLSSPTGTWIKDSEATDPTYWARHVRESVRFSEGVLELEREPERILLEVGPGRTLTTLALQIDPQARAVDSLGGEAGEPVMLLEAAGRLWERGVKLDFTALGGGARRLRLHLPTYPWQRSRHFVDPPPLSSAAPPVAASEGVDGGLGNLLRAQLQLMQSQLEALAAAQPPKGDA